ncbi:hypothetical protein [Zhouia amylolytica]|uniref:hypothetical protein n=1 Tax=Zhouia amylolytica TaxID=376730 RepID=UPI0020CD66C1|nr:hypothetical protein [Zhouia amylolytica]MCQ0110065.1 hypothetical protein [Zhouia amylolytica]
MIKNKMYKSLFSSACLLLVAFTGGNSITGCNSATQSLSDENETYVEFEDGKIRSIEGKRQISGIYPHLATYSHNREDGTYEFGNECGIGALAVWNEDLYMVNYAAHQPKGSEHQLYIVDKDKRMEMFKGSIGGTPAARLVHQESNQLFIGPYVIDDKGGIRVIPVKEMPGRLTAIARHLKDPENMVYYYDMEGMLYEVNVHTLTVNKLFQDPLPGWHGKGAYTSQGKLVLANNGEHASEGRVTHDNDDWGSEHYIWMDSWMVPDEGVFGPENLGVLAEYDGEDFKIVERHQFTDVTTKNGIYAIPNEQAPLWSIGWDKRSVRLKMLDNDQWTTYLLPKATYNNDPAHGWFTEWPRIRSVGNGKMMMDMHGMFFDFPESFSVGNTAGIRPMGSHLRYIPDFLNWNGQIVLATDETSIQGNPLSGQPQSNLWFGDYDELSNWGPASAYGAIWLKDNVEADKSSLPFLVAGFDKRIIHLKNYGNTDVVLTLEIDEKGDGNWTVYKDINLDAMAYRLEVLHNDLKAEWLRITSNKSALLTASFHFTDSALKRPGKDLDLFKGIADMDYEGEVSHSKLYSNKFNYNLSVFNGKISNGKFKVEQDLEFTKFDFQFKEGVKDTTAKRVLENEVVWNTDDASVYIDTKRGRLRLPVMNQTVAKKFPSGAIRNIREVESERELANIAGTFYEVPLFKVGQEPYYDMMRPVSSHGRQISDFNTWNGLLVLSGIEKNAEPSEHIYTSEDGETLLWFGGIDDIWSFGKPIGEGGPWKDKAVKAHELSDMYLMTGFDRKTLTLISDKDTKITLLIHVNPYLEEPFEYKTFDLKANQEFVYEFPDDFSAHWAQLKSSKDANLTAWFVYK